MCYRCGWKEIIDQIDELLDSGDYEFARETLEGILEWVLDNRHITKRQQQAIENIMKAGQ